MKRMNRFMVVLVLILLPFIHSQFTHAEEPNRTTPKLKFAIVNPELGTPETVLSSFKPLMRWISDKVKRKIEVIILADVAQTVAALEKGEVDLGYTGIIDFFNIQQLFPIKPMVTIMKDKSNFYTACLVVHLKNKAITLEELKGTPFGYTSFHKAIGGLFPQIVFLENGMGSDLGAIFSEIKSYSSDISGIRDLLADKIFSCSISQSTLDTIAITSPGISRNLHVLIRLEGLMFAPFFYRSDLDEELKEKCIKEVLAFSRTIEGRQLLMMFKVDGLTRIMDDDYRADKTRAIRLGYVKEE